MNITDLKRQAESIRIPQDMKRQIVLYCNDEIENINHKKEKCTLLWFGKKLAVAIVLIVFLFSGTSALVANVNDFYYALYYVSPHTAQFFMPVNMSCVKDNIIMTVDSVSISKNKAEILVSLQDLSGKRIDETTNLNESYGIFSAGDCSVHCEMYGYVEEENKAVFLIQMEPFSGEEFNIKDKVTFIVGNFMSDKEKYMGIAEDIDLSMAERNPNVKIIEKSENIYYEIKEITVLDQNLSISTPVNNIEITGMGYIDGNLHIQARCVNPWENGSYLWICLDESGKKRISPTDCIRFNDGEDVIYEYVFEGIDSTENCKLYGRFYNYNNYTEGPWKVTFMLEKNK